MNIQVKLKDHISHEIVYQGEAVLETNNSRGRHIKFKDEKNAFYWKIYEEALIIESISQVKVYLGLRLNRNTQGHIDTEFGRIDLVCHTLTYHNEKDRIEIKYEISQGNENQLFHFELEIQ